MPSNDRRRFLRLGGTSLVLLGAGRVASLADALAGPSSAPAPPSGVLVVFFQRGAADGLHEVIPYRERAYRSLRGSLAFPEPGRTTDRPHDLGDGFALHPALAALMPLYAEGRLAAVHAVGSPDATRSHFDAQDYMESGTPGNKGTRDGWMARTLETLLESEGARRTPFAAVALASAMPRSLSGTASAIAMADFSRLGSPAGTTRLEESIERMYERDDDPSIAAAGSEAFEAVELFRRKDPLAIPPRAGISYPRGRTARPFQQLAALIKADLGICVAFLESGGWDTHFNQGTATGQLANGLRELGGSIAAFLADVGPQAPVTLLVATEFGRAVAVNGAGGTDHGHGAAMLVAGHGVAGGRVAGEWPGLDRASLHEGRDLAVTTDFRALFSEVATHTLGLPPTTPIFPGFRPPTTRIVMA